MSKDELKKLTKPEKKVAAKVMKEEGYSLREIEDILGVSDSAVLRYSREQIPEELKQFEATLKSMFEDKERILAAKAFRRVDNRIDYAQIMDAWQIYKDLRGKGASPQILQQINANKLEVVLTRGEEKV